MKYLSPLIMITLLSLTANLLSGCAKGQRFDNAPSPSAPTSDYSLVYILKGDASSFDGSSTQFSVNQIAFAHLHRFEYTWLHLAPGQHHFKAEKYRYTLTVEENKTYYLSLHQLKQKTSAGKVDSEIVLKPVSYAAIKQQLRSSRFRASELQFDKSADQRPFKQKKIKNSATIRFRRGPNYTKQYPKFSVSLFDDAINCQPGQSVLNSQHLFYNKAIELPTGNYQTFSVDFQLSLSDKASAFLNCKNVFSFKPKANEQYMITIDIDKGSLARSKDYCIVQIENTVSDHVVPVIQRTFPIKSSLNPPQCKGKELARPIWRNLSKQRFECRVMISGTWRDC